ncbi:phosphorylcholine transferase LicD [Ruminococcus sp.]|uniref:LicD family protein n=1 Tax=Ruminococcus sp. TaxID=41978 RepID=UPI003864603E
MIDSVIKNEITMSADYIKRKELLQDGVCIVGSHPVARYLSKTTESLGGIIPLFSSATDVQGNFSHLWYVLEAENYSADELDTSIKTSEQQHADFLCIILLPNIKRNHTIQKYAEMELFTAMGDLLTPLRKQLSGHQHIRAIFLDRIFGGEFDCFDLAAISREVQENNVIHLTQSMANRYASALYISDAIDAVLTVSKYGKEGNVYNASSFYLSEYQLMSEIYMMLARHGVRLTVSGEPSEPEYGALSNGKLRSLGYENVCDFSDALRYTLLHHLERFSIQTDRIHDGYSGKLNTLRVIEKDMLREIDRICRKHDIKYFISYGTMLGAVRHGGFIPWDDDVDVAMLRSEFEKFRQIAPKELNNCFSYESHVNHNGYHYFFDRITAKDTYFASKYSDDYDMHKGISIDIFVLDNVPADPKAAYRFWQGLMRRRMIMNVRWKNTARKGKAYLLSKLLLPFLRLRSMDSYSRSYEKAVRKYEHKDTGWVMPASSDHKYRGTFPIETFSEVIPYRFDDVDTFIPVGYKDFLKAWYTDDYMDMLPLSQQNPFHDYYRLDLGTHIQDNAEPQFDYMGELL